MPAVDRECSKFHRCRSVAEIVVQHSGGGELLRDEQIYLAHKAAHPERYPPNEAVLREYPILNEQIAKYKPTRVQLQVFDGCAHVIPTLSITTPAKVGSRDLCISTTD